MCWEKEGDTEGKELSWVGKRGDLYLQRFVPATCGENPCLSHFKPPHALDRTVVLSYLGGCAG